MAGVIKKLKKGEEAEIHSYRKGGDEVDKALGDIVKKTGKPVREIVRKSIVDYNKNLKTKVLKDQKRNG